MKSWDRNILGNFTVGLSNLWIAYDPDNILLDNDLQKALQDKGFAVLEYEDSISFRARFENSTHRNTNKHTIGLKNSIIMRYGGGDMDHIPYDYLRKGIMVNLQLAKIFSYLNYSIVRHLENDHYRAMHLAYCNNCTKVLGKQETIDFVFREVFYIDTRSLSDASRFWQNIFQIYVNKLAFPKFFFCYLEALLSKSYSGSISIREVLSSKSYLLHVIQSEWKRYISSFPVQNISNPITQVHGHQIPFDSPEIRGIVYEMFLTGDLQPVRSRKCLPNLPMWAKIGVKISNRDNENAFTRDVRLAGQSMPRDIRASNKDWIEFAFRLGHILSRYYRENFQRDTTINSHVDTLQAEADSYFRLWLEGHFSGLSTMSISNGPVMGHHIPRYLSLRHASGEQKIGLILIDGMSIDQWIQIWEMLIDKAPNLVKQEFGCFAWPPTITSVSRQAIFSGLTPTNFSDTVYRTSAEAQLWTKFWKEHGVPKTEVSLEKGVNRHANLDSLEKVVTRPSIKIIAIVINMIDDLSHSNILGKQDVSRQISVWCDREKIIQRVCFMLMENDFNIYITSDHGNVDAVGVGAVSQGPIADISGQRVRVYRNSTLASSIPDDIDTFQFEVGSLPSNFLPYYASGRGAFVQTGKKVVSHGGISLEEMIVPFTRISTNEHSQ